MYWHILLNIYIDKNIYQLKSLIILFIYLLEIELYIGQIYIIYKYIYVLILILK